MWHLNNWSTSCRSIEEVCQPRQPNNTKSLLNLTVTLFHLWYLALRSFLITTFAKKMWKAFILQLCLLRREHVCRVQKSLKVCLPHHPVISPGEVLLSRWDAPILLSWFIECFGETLLRPTKTPFLWICKDLPHSSFCFYNNRAAVLLDSTFLWANQAWKFPFSA